MSRDKDIAFLKTWLALDDPRAVVEYLPSVRSALEIVLARYLDAATDQRRYRALRGKLTLTEVRALMLRRFTNEDEDDPAYNREIDGTLDRFVYPPEETQH